MKEIKKLKLDSFNIISRHKILSDSKLEASVQEQVHNAFTSKQELKK